MRVALALLRHFPHGGLQRDALATAVAARDAGHEVVVYTRRWEGERPAHIDVRLLDGGGWTNHGRALRFGRALASALVAAPADAVVGFDRLPGLDAWFAADPCFAERLSARGPLYRLTPRARTFAALERGVLEPASGTRILLVDARQREVFRRHYGTPEERFLSLPPGVAPDRAAGDDAAALRAAGRAEFGVADDEHLLLLLGSDFARKGLDRAVEGLAALPQALRARTRLLAVGADRPGPWLRRARRLGVADRVAISPGRDDVPRLLQAADLLVHPARVENTGTVLVEALAAGLPVLCSAACGYACHVEAARAGTVLAEPFEPARFAASLAELLSARREPLRAAALSWARETDLGGLHRCIVAELEAIAARREPGA